MAGFSGKPILEILIKKIVVRTNMRSRFLIKVCLISIHNCPVILGCFLVGVYLILSEPTQFQPPYNHLNTHDSAFPLSLTMTWHIWWNFMENLMVHSTWLHFATQKSFVQKPGKSRKYHEYSRIFEKIAYFCTSWCVLSYQEAKNHISKHGRPVMYTRRKP